MQPIFLDHGSYHLVFYIGKKNGEMQVYRVSKVCFKLHPYIPVANQTLWKFSRVFDERNVADLNIASNWKKIADTNTSPLSMITVTDHNHANSTRTLETSYPTTARTVRLLVELREQLNEVQPRIIIPVPTIIFYNKKILPGLIFPYIDVHRCAPATLAKLAKLVQLIYSQTARIALDICSPGNAYIDAQGNFVLPDPELFLNLTLSADKDIYNSVSPRYLQYFHINYLHGADRTYRPAVMTVIRLLSQTPYPNHNSALSALCPSMQKTRPPKVASTYFWLLLLYDTNCYNHISAQFIHWYHNHFSDNDKQEISSNLITRYKDLNIEAQDALLLFTHKLSSSNLTQLAIAAELLSQKAINHLLPHTTQINLITLLLKLKLNQYKHDAENMTPQQRVLLATCKKTRPLLFHAANALSSGMQALKIETISQYCQRHKWKTGASILVAALFTLNSKQNNAPFYYATKCFISMLGCIVTGAAAARYTYVNQLSNSADVPSQHKIQKLV